MKNIFKLLLCVLTLATVICAFAVMASAEVKTGTIYISTCASDYKPADESGSISAWNRNATVFLKKGVFSQDENGKFSVTIGQSTLKPSDHAIASAADEANTASKYVYVPAHYAKDACTYKAEGRQLEPSGLTYSFDTETGVMTISGKIKKNADGTDVPWILPTPEIDPQTDNVAFGPVTNVNKVIVEESTGITRLYNHCMNSISNLNTVEIPSTVTFLDCESLGRNGYLRTLKVIGSEFETGIDLRNITTLDQQAFHTSLTQTDTAIYIGQTLANKKNVFDATTGALKTPIVKNWFNSGTKRTITVYTPTGEPCDFARALEMARGADSKYVPLWKYDGVNYTDESTNSPKLTVYVRSYASCGVEALGYRARTEEYNGLRAEFKRTETGIKITKVVDAGAILANPVEEYLSNGGSDCIEFGVLVTNAALAEEKGMTLTKVGDEYVTNDEKIVKVVAQPEKVGPKGDFYVTVTNFVGADQMGAKVCYVGYEIYADGTIAYAARLEPVSLYDTVLGLYEKGLINTSSGDHDVLWGVLDNFKVDMKAQMWDGDNLKSDIAAYIKNETIYYSSQTATSPVNGCSGTDNTANFMFSATDDGDLVWSGYPNTLVSFFEKSNGDYAIIVHLNEENYEAYLANPTAKNYFQSGKMTKNYIGENFLSGNITGISAKALIVDYGITDIGSNTLQGFGADTFSWFTGDEVNSRTPATLGYKGALETIILPQTVMTVGSNGGQCLHSNNQLKTLYRVGTSEEGATEGLVDLSFLPVTADNDNFYNELLNRAQSMTAVNLPSTNGHKIKLGQRFFFNCSKLAAIYVDGKLVGSGSTMDFTGTGYVGINAKETLQSCGAFLTAIFDGETWSRETTWGTWVKQAS